MCPDERLGGKNDARVVYGKRQNGVTTVVYERSFAAEEEGLDLAIPSSKRVNVIAAIGTLNSRMEANYHSRRTGPNGNISLLILWFISGWFGGGAHVREIDRQ